MLTIEFTSSFKRDYKRMMKKHYNETEFRKVINLLVNQEQEVLRTKYKDHALQGNWKGFRELHVQSDWLLIYKIDGKKLILTLVRTGSHDKIL
ncbi:type II toxin-antitoxin system YafQ family toxin [Enterococcus faecium]|uniref:type II toxin-antitoxin system RelE/ParE family toxin n=1 Tax=Enterococcus faecium TaxID=1352 RepID=UPI001913CF71|nr:type II toxin-antitoxin system YafQ family toxin [Enterococcus faecium]MBK5028573.1 type II toxin-antitoxin system YafQ family toxin [Enterococcus faecium]MBK5039275.1 type II toxin-antitoxin system YafQ family toxin [Enterococcus faecium]MBK5044216.1 type II toxin-antitoxin system YafQ family toxin [Enterococcus faecium]MBK5069140.1 type II toxin-antitoxin system YafQ family toxin [Enterococcus faecium]MBK5132554.1 type II toxin-antitoxin system YafQ family toxin [Enterococcus faecium]